MVPLKVTRIGASLGVLLELDMALQLGVQEGDTVYVANNSALAGSDYGQAAGFCADPATVEQLQVGHEFMRDYHAAFRALS